MQQCTKSMHPPPLCHTWWCLTSCEKRTQNSVITPKAAKHKARRASTSSTRGFLVIVPRIGEGSSTKLSSSNLLLACPRCLLCQEKIQGCETVQMEIEYVSKHPTNDGYLEDHLCFPITLKACIFKGPCSGGSDFPLCTHGQECSFKCTCQWRSKDTSFW